MGIPETFEVIWSGCNHTEKERGSVFDGDYNRFCAKCGNLLTGTWQCILCNVKPIKIDIDVEKIKAQLEICPKCGEFFNYQLR